MWQRMAFVIAVVLLGVSGGIVALFVRGIHAERGAVGGASLFLRWLSRRAGWLPLKLPGPAGCPAIFEMHVIEELKRNFELFPLLDCVQSRGSFPWHLWEQTQEHQADSPLSC
jgi:hypothetical protein